MSDLQKMIDVCFKAGLSLDVAFKRSFLFKMASVYNDRLYVN